MKRLLCILIMLSFAAGCGGKTVYIVKDINTEREYEIPPQIATDGDLIVLGNAPAIALKNASLHLASLWFDPNIPELLARRLVGAVDRQVVRSGRAPVGCGLGPTPFEYGKDIGSSSFPTTKYVKSDKKVDFAKLLKLQLNEMDVRWRDHPDDAKKKYQAKYDKLKKDLKALYDKYKNGKWFIAETYYQFGLTEEGRKNLIASPEFKACRTFLEEGGSKKKTRRVLVTHVGFLHYKFDEKLSPIFNELKELDRRASELEVNSTWAISKEVLKECENRFGEVYKRRHCLRIWRESHLYQSYGGFIRGTFRLFMAEQLATPGFPMAGKYRILWWRRKSLRMLKNP